MSIGTLTVNVAANTPRANKALQSTASAIRLIGRAGQDAVPSLSLVKASLTAIGAPAAAGAAGKGLTYVGGGLVAIGSSKSAAATGVLKHVGTSLAVIGAPGAAAAAGRGLMSVGTGLSTIGRAGAVGGGLMSTVGSLAKIATIFVPGGTLIKLLALGGAAIGIRAANKEISEMVERLDSMAKRAKRIDIGLPQLDQLHYAAGLTGVDNRTVDVAIEKMNIRIAEATRGGGEAVKVLDELGLSAKTLNAQPTEQKFLAITKALEGYTNQADKLRIASKLFEEEGAGLVNTMNLGAAGVKSLMTEAAALGGPTKEMAEKAERFADASARADKTWGALADKIGAVLIDWKTFKADGSTYVGQLGNQLFDATFRNPWDRGEPLKSPVAQHAPTPFLGGGYAGAPPALSHYLGADPTEALSARRRRQRLAAEERRNGGWVDKDGILSRGGGRTWMTEWEKTRPMTSMLRSGASGLGDALKGSYDPIQQGIFGLQGVVGRIKGGYQSFRQQGYDRLAQGLDPLTGLKPNTKNRLAAPRSINSLIEADSAEGYMALRANRRGGGDTAKHIAKTADNTKRAADLQQQAVTVLQTIGGYFAGARPPASA
jgi:hypothetical protein